MLPSLDDRGNTHECGRETFSRLRERGAPSSSAPSLHSKARQQVAALLILNVALTIPARILVGMLVDKVGPLLLAISGGLCPRESAPETLALARFLLAFVGAGFVVGIRMG